MIVPHDKRITAKHLRDLNKANVTTITVPDDYLLGRVLGKTIIDQETGEVIANANDEITETVLAAMRAARVRKFDALFTNELDHGATSPTHCVWMTRPTSSRLASPSIA